MNTELNPYAPLVWLIRDHEREHRLANESGRGFGEPLTFDGFDLYTLNRAFDAWRLYEDVACDNGPLRRVYQQRAARLFERLGNVIDDELDSLIEHPPASLRVVRDAKGSSQ